MKNSSEKMSSATSVASPLFRTVDGTLANTLAIGYAFGGYGLGVYLLSASGIAYVGGILLLAHSLVVAAYLIHECCHQSLFATRADTPDWNRTLGIILAWLTGACYGRYEAIRDKHLRHHFDRADIVSVDYRQLLARHPVLQNIVKLGQWLCLPAVELLMHVLVMLRPFAGPDIREQPRVMFVLAVRITFFLVLGLVGGWALLVGYAIAWVMFISLLGFMDAFQHQYLLLEGLDKTRGQSPTRDRSRFPADYFSRDYEEQRTFSNLLSRRWPILNLLVLNFCYHNAHHRSPMEPWYRLPRLHRQHYGSDDRRVVPLLNQLQAYFRFRTARVTAPAHDRLGEGDNTGAAGVSFLTPL